MESSGGRPIQVGNEFSSVEALWSQFENVMARDQPDDDGGADDGGEGEQGGRERDRGGGEGPRESEGEGDKTAVKSE